MRTDKQEVLIFTGHTTHKFSRWRGDSGEVLLQEVDEPVGGRVVGGDGGGVLQLGLDLLGQLLPQFNAEKTERSHSVMSLI